MGMREPVVRVARGRDVGDVAPLILDPNPTFPEMFGSRRAALRVARWTFRLPWTMHSRRYALVGEVDGRVVGLAVAVPGRLWPRVRAGTGLAMLAAAPFAIRPLLREGRVLDRITAPIPPWSLYVSTLAVARDRRGRGIGARLLDAAATVAGRAGLPAVTLDVAIENRRALAFYLREGFRETGRVITTEAERRIVDTEGSIRMEKPVPER